MERIKIKVELREETGKEAVKKMRKRGLTPAVVYSENSNIILTVSLESLKVLRAIDFSESTVIDMQIVKTKDNKTETAEAIPVLIKDMQFNPLTEAVSHIDFLKVSLKEKIKVNIPVVLIGESKTVKEEAATVEQILRELEVEGLPLDIPEKIEVDVSELGIGHSLHVSDLVVAANLKVISDPKATVVTVVAKKEEVAEEEVVAEEGAPTEPEVIKEKKDEPSDKKESSKEPKDKEPKK